VVEPSADGLPAILRDMLRARRDAVIADTVHRSRWFFSIDGYDQLRRACALGSWPLDPPDPATGQPRNVLGLPWEIDGAQVEPVALKFLTACYGETAGMADGPR